MLRQSNSGNSVAIGNEAKVENNAGESIALGKGSKVTGKANAEVNATIAVLNLNLKVELETIKQF